MSDQILLLLVYLLCTKNIWYINCYTAFLLYQWYVQYQRLQEMTIFDWYTTGIWHDGIRIITFFVAVLWTVNITSFPNYSIKCLHLMQATLTVTLVMVYGVIMKIHSHSTP